MVVVTQEDLTTLKGDWLTDNILAFWQEYLENEYLKKYPSSAIFLLRPSMAYMLMTQPDTALLCLNLPNFALATHIFLPVNDNINLTLAEGGSHWSLLLISVIDGIAFHYVLSARGKVSVSMAGKYVDAANARREMVKIVEAFRQEGERTRSGSRT